MCSLVKDLSVLTLKAGLATAPFCGGIAEIFGWVVEGRFVNRRLAIIEKMLGDDSTTFLTAIQKLNEHDYYSIRKLLKFHCFDALPELTDTTAKVIIDYAMNRQNRVGDDQIIEMLCQLNASDISALKTIKKIILEKGDGDYTKIIEWNDISSFRHGDPEGKFKMSQLVLVTIQNEAGDVVPEVSEGLNCLAISFDKLNRLKIICAYHQIHVGMNNDFDIDQFVITPFGIKILDFIDINDENMTYI